MVCRVSLGGVINLLRIYLVFINWCLEKIKEVFGVCFRSFKIDMVRVGESAFCLFRCIGRYKIFNDIMICF